MGIWQSIKNVFSSVSRSISGSFQKVVSKPPPAKPIDTKWIEKYVAFWNKQPMRVTKHGIKPPLPKSIMKIGGNKYPSVGSFKPIESRSDKKIIVVTKVKGRDAKTGRRKTVKMTVGADEIMTVQQLKEKILKNKKVMTEILPDIYDLVPEDVVLVAAYLNVLNTQIEGIENLKSELYEV